MNEVVTCAVPASVPEQLMGCRVAMVATSVRDLWHFRRRVVEHLLAAGVEVWFVGPRDDPAEEFLRAGVRMMEWSLDRGSVAVFKNLEELFGLGRIYRRLRPTLVHHFGAKAVIYGSVAARMSLPRPRVVSTIPGLGHSFVDDGSLLRRLVGGLYRVAIAGSDALVFLNPDDPETLGVLGSEKVYVNRGGEGVDTRRFSVEAVDATRIARLRWELGIDSAQPVVLMVSRMIEEKGVREFVAAAERVRQRRPAARFLLVGEVDRENPAAVPERDLEDWNRRGLVTYLGRRTDVVELMAVSSVVVLATYYREGLPQVLLEGAAMERPLIATDVPGCREVVVPEVNGLLVRPRDIAGLVEAIERVLPDVTMQRAFGRAGRELVMAQFGQERAAAETLYVYRRVMERSPLPTALVSGA